MWCCLTFVCVYIYASSGEMNEYPPECQRSAGKICPSEHTHKCCQSNTPASWRYRVQDTSTFICQSNIPASWRYRVQHTSTCICQSNTPASWRYRVQHTSTFICQSNIPASWRYRVQHTSTFSCIRVLLYDIRILPLFDNIFVPKNTDFGWFVLFSQTYRFPKWKWLKRWRTCIIVILNVPASKKCRWNVKIYIRKTVFKNYCRSFEWCYLEVA